jgi:ABC-type nitrate/sulfonate/bicarbonate transport system substrate-binding protein
MKEVYGDSAITGLTTLPSTISSDPQTVKSVVCGVQDALAYIRANRNQSLALLAKRFPDISPDVARAALERVIESGIVPVTAEVSQAAWDKAVAVRVAVGDFESPGPFSDYVDNQFGSSCPR